MNKREKLVKKMYKLLCNHPYSIVRIEVDRIGRQIRELDKRTVVVDTPKAEM